MFLAKSSSSNIFLSPVRATILTERSGPNLFSKLFEQGKDIMEKES